MSRTPNPNVKTAGRSGGTWRAIRARVLTPRPLVCCLCYAYINHDLPGTHRLGPTVQHLDGNHHNNEPWNLAPAHNKCNVIDGNQRRNNRHRPTPTSRDRNPSRTW